MTPTVRILPDGALLALENAKNETETEPEDTPNSVYEEYVAGKWYYNGATVRFEDSSYVCTAPEGQVCVWSPTEYPAYWQLVEEVTQDGDSEE